jgi:hypothetical protein
MERRRNGMNRNAEGPGVLIKASASLMADGGLGFAAGVRLESEPCCGLGASEEESAAAPFRRRRAEGASHILASCDYRLHIGI